MIVTASGFALALEAVFPGWAACARLFSGDDRAAPAGDRAPGDKAAGSDAGADDADPDLESFWRGDEVTIEAVYRSYARRLFGAARAVVGDAEAESMVHEVFVELIRNPELRARFTGGSLGAWLGSIARLKSLEHLRRTGRSPPREDRAADPSSSSPEPRLEARDLLLRFCEAHVAPEQAEFFRRRFLDGRTQVEAAAALGIPRSTLEGWEHRLSERLRRFIWESSR
jgi:RNA polymerase sigma factor (sigma-70 family)